MSDDDGGGGPWLAPESERERGGDRTKQSSEGDRNCDGSVPIVASSFSSVSQLLGSMSLSNEAGCSETNMHGRSLSFAEGLASLGASASPARSAAAAGGGGGGGAAAAATSTPSSPDRNWPGFFAEVHGSPALSSGGTNNWVEAIDRAIAEMGDPATLPGALARLAQDPYAPGDIYESSYWGEFVDSLPAMLLDERAAVAAAAARLAAAVMDEATGGGGGGGGDGGQGGGTGAGCCPAQLADLLGAAAAALGRASSRRAGGGGGGKDRASAAARAAASASASLAARALLTLPRSWPAAREGVLVRACQAAASLLLPPEIGGGGEGEGKEAPAPKPAPAVAFLVAALIEEQGGGEEDSSPSSALVFSWLHRWAGTPRVARHLFAALGCSSVEGHAAAVARLSASASSAASAAFSASSSLSSSPSSAAPLALSVALVAATLGSAHGRRLLSDQGTAAADLCSLATRAAAAAGFGSREVEKISGESEEDEGEEEGIVCSSARLGVLQLATCASPSSPLLCGGSIGKLLGPPLSLAAAAVSAAAAAEKGAPSPPSASSSLAFSVRALCLLCRTPAGVDALLRAREGGRGGEGEEGEGIPWPRVPTSTSTAAAAVELVLSQQQQQGTLAPLERALRADPLARLHFLTARDPSTEEVAVALASRGAPAALAALSAAAGADGPHPLASEAVAVAEVAGAPSHVAAAAAAVALAEAAEAAASFAAALLVRGGGEGGEGRGEKASRAPFRLPESAVAAALAVVAAASAAAEGSLPLPPWCSREMPAIEALLAPSSSSTSSAPLPSTESKEAAELDSSSAAVALTAVSR